MTTYTAIHLVQRPRASIGPELFEVKQHQTPKLSDGDIQVRQSHMSLDPAMLGWMSPDTESYIPPVELGSVMRSSGYGEVIASEHPNFKQGDKVTGMFGWQEIYTGSAKGIHKVDSALHPEMVLSVLALPGLTATQGFFFVADPKEGETMVVTGAAGSVGSIVGQLGKAIGMRVIGVVGSEEKAKWITQDLGFDGAINYKTDDLGEQLDQLVPEGVDVYFENTGGEIQHRVFERMRAHGRIAVCGMIADYTKAEPMPGPNWMNIIKKRLRIEGYTMPDHFHRTKELLETLTPYVQGGKIQYRAHTIDGLEAAMDGLNLLFTGKNNGKLIVKL
ncbi:NADP-dependent oxidoreductase [Aliidiomarina maris]|uniref:NADP-dependent oxidoreductase n=1 Tax=Aliidiomarina maris TaxID=531312 RepID=A0A327X0D4_9GAMM|nr:NADP-dependent oxidoreductase [Aliidiomarina maris]RAJ98426.1 hypothetical protein B0I24_105179 [Aliidiomarina maris]RUO24759.1 NADP-dependent oxidoreductase [Aliidiomarina maris]